MRAPKFKQTMSESEMLALIDAMPEEAKEHFKAVVRLLLPCYGPDTEERSEAVVLIANPEDEKLVVLSMNANDLACAEMLTAANQIMGELVMQDAPAPGRYN